VFAAFALVIVEQLTGRFSFNHHLQMSEGVVYL
jgi:hypothetical protein